MDFCIIKHNLEKAWGIHWGNSAEILHFVRKVERQTFIQIWTYQRPASGSSLFKIQVHTNTLFRLTVYVHTLFIRFHVQINIVLGGSALCQISFCNSERQRQIMRHETQSLVPVCFMEMWTLSCDWGERRLASLAIAKTIRCAAYNPLPGMWRQMERRPDRIIRAVSDRDKSLLWWLLAGKFWY